MELHLHIIRFQIQLRSKELPLHTLTTELNIPSDVAETLETRVQTEMKKIFGRA